MDKQELDYVVSILEKERELSLDHRLLLSAINRLGRNVSRINEFMDKNPDYRRMYNLIADLR